MMELASFNRAKFTSGFLRKNFARSWGSARYKDTKRRKE